MSDYQFTNDWFERVKGPWPDIIAKLPQCKRVLEIGSYEGASACWLIENAIEDGGTITCIDTWEGGEEHAGIDMDDVFVRFNQNVGKAALKRESRVFVNVVRENSAAALMDTRQVPSRNDLIYIDGSHQAPDVLTDAVLSWQLLNVGGIMIFDDYEWMGHESAAHRPKMAINAFVAVFTESIETIHKGYQLAIRRIK